MKRLLIIMALVAAVIGGIASDLTAQERIDRVVYGISVDIESTDPQAAPQRMDQIVLANIFDGLVTRDRDMNLIPALAKSWEVSEDGLTWTFYLRDDVRWHNGDPFTARDVEFSMRRLLDPAFPGQLRTAYAGRVVDVRVVDDYTVQFLLAEPYPALVTYMTTTSGWFPIVPRDYIEKVGVEGFRAAPVGTGPFKFVEWVRDERIVLEANEDYYLGAPVVKQVVFRPIPDEATRVAAVVSGEVDITGPITPEQIPVVQGSRTARIVSNPELRRIYMHLRTDIPPFNDVRVRRAVNHAVDVDAIIEAILLGFADRMHSPLTDMEFGYTDDVVRYEYNPEKARQLLREAGYGDGLTITIDAPRGRYMKDVEAVQAIAGFLQEVGINAEVRFHEWGRYVEKAQTRDMGHMWLAGWGGNTFDADITLSSVLMCEGGSPVWRGFYCNPRVDELINQARYEPNSERREQLYHEALRLITDDAAWLFLWNQRTIWAVNERLDWLPRADEALDPYSIRPRR